MHKVSIIQFILSFQYNLIRNFMTLIKGVISYREKFIILILPILFISCKDDTLPKPKAYLRLAYEDSNYHSINSNCPYSFEISNQAKAVYSDKCWVTVEYPKLNATLNVTYRDVENNMKQLLIESEKLTFNHAIKADRIGAPIRYENFDKNVYGALTEVTGNAASPIQFYLTDSTRHFITGALYFNVQPNYDSIFPAVKYLEKDIRHLMETLEWKNNK